MDALSLGPFALPLGPLLLLAAVLTSGAVGKWRGRRQNLDIEPQIWKILIVGVVVARAAFVLAYREAYLATPWHILDIRDGGFSTPAGLLGALAMSLWLLWRRREQRQPLALAVLSGLAVWGGGMLATAGPPAGTAALPQLVLQDLEGKPVALDSLSGKPMVVNLWASWCGPCRREMPALRDAQARYPDVRFVFANQGESAETVQAYLAAEGLVLRHVLRDAQHQMAAQTGSRGLPTTLFYDARGRLVDQRMGELSAATLAHRLAAFERER